MTWVVSLCLGALAVAALVFWRRQAAFVAACVRDGVCPRCGSRRTARSRDQGPFWSARPRPTMACEFCENSVTVPRALRKEEIALARRAAAAERVEKLEKKLERELN